MGKFRGWSTRVAIVALIWAAALPGASQEDVLVIPPSAAPSTADAELPEAGFTDTVGSLFQSEVDWLAAVGVTLGCNPPDNTLFCPDDPVTRGQMAAFLHRALPSLVAQHPALGFGDIAGSVFADDISWLSRTGVTLGCDPPANTRFCPRDPVTRGQIAAFLHRADP